MSRPLDTIARAAFVVYALLIVALTHWPSLRIEAGVPRPDLWAHFAAFFGWTMLLLATGWIAPRSSWKNPAIGVPVAIAYAGVDEFTQGLPGLNRFVSFEDFAANCIGVEIAAVCWIAGLVFINRRDRGGPTTPR